MPEIFVVRESTKDRLHQVYSLALAIRRHRQYNRARHVADTASHTTALVVEFKQAIAKVEDDIERRYDCWSLRSVCSVCAQAQ